MTDAALLDHITRLPHAKGNFKQLVRELAAKGATRADLDVSLARLLARGDLVEPRPGHYVATASSREYAIGRINVHRDGYGFLLSERPLEGIQGDVYIPADSARRAMHGDRVLVRIARIEPGGRADGEIVKVLKRAHPTVVGEFRVGRRGNYVVPQEGRIQQWIDIPAGMEIPAGVRQIDRIGAAPLQVSDPADLDLSLIHI